MILLTLSDEEFFKNLLTHASKQTQIGQEFSLALMNKHGDIFLASSDLAEPQKLADDPNVVLMRAQAKFMYGDLSYSPVELTNQFLPRRDRNLAEYQNSSIYKALN